MLLGKLNDLCTLYTAHNDGVQKVTCYIFNHIGLSIMWSMHALVQLLHSAVIFVM